MSQIQTGLLVLLLTFLGVVGYNVYLHESTPSELSYTKFLTLVEDGKIKKIHLRGGLVKGEDITMREFSSFIPDVPSIMPLLESQSVEITAEKDSETFGGFLSSMVPVFLT